MPTPETFHQSVEPLLDFDFDTLTRLAEQSKYSLEEFVDISWKLAEAGALFFVTNSQQLDDISQKLKAGYQPVKNEGWVIGLFINSPNLVLGKGDLCEAICAERNITEQDGYEIIDRLIKSKLLAYQDSGDLSLNNVARFLVGQLA